MVKLTQIEVDPELLRRACAGDAKAEAELYSVVAPAVFGLVRRLICNRTIAEDVFQESMVSFFLHLSSFRNAAPIGAWLRQIAVSKSLMHLRSPWHRMRLELDNDLHSADLPEVKLCNFETQTAAQLDLERALARLSPVTRAIIWLFDVEGYSHEEIGRLFKRSASFSKSQVSRGHQKLRAWFEPVAEHSPCASM